LLCNSGKRASALGNLLETEQAFLEVYIVEDGMQGWNRWIESKP
jgi:rhodanese-related sulfurtransferase